MFIGDSGSLIMGTLAYVITCRIIHTRHMDVNDQFCVSMMFAIYALPVFDTLRVMIVRMLNGKSPFKPDRTHLHHMFVDIGYPHIMISAILLSINCLVIGVWYLSAQFMNSINGQFFVVIGAAVLLVPGLYFILRRVSVRHPEIFERIKKHSKRVSRKPIHARDQITELIDGKVRRRRMMKRNKQKKIVAKGE